MVVSVVVVFVDVVDEDSARVCGGVHRERFIAFVVLASVRVGVIAVLCLVEPCARNPF